VSNSPPRVPIWGEPAPGSRRPRFTREQIAAVAIEIADREGFEAISMRRVAEELGAATMTLYHYVRTKDDLVALMDNALMAEVVIDELPDHWRDALTAIARASFGAFIRHPWALTSASSHVGGPNSLRHFEQSLAAVRSTSLGTADKLQVLFTVDDYVFGHVLRRQELADVQERSNDWAIDLIKAGGYPELEALLGDDVEAGLEAWEEVMRDVKPDTMFEVGLQALLDGLALRYALEPSP
jgi:AcrR family transcriptional regulator